MNLRNLPFRYFTTFMGIGYPGLVSGPPPAASSIVPSSGTQEHRPGSGACRVISAAMSCSFSAGVYTTVPFAFRTLM
jgi:hypothetical protein